MQIPGISEVILKNIKKDKYQKYLELMPDFKNEKSKKILTIVLTLTASIILGLFAINPTLSTIASLRKQLDDDKFLEQKMQEKINNLSILQQKYSVLQNDLPIIFDAVPKNSEIPSMIALIQEVSNQTNITLVSAQSFQVEVSNDTQINKKYSSYEYSVTARGEYNNLINFIDKLFNFQRILTIEDITIAKSNDAGIESLRVNVKGNAYFKQ